ncbi:MAG: glycosyltransferase family 2 protein [Desulfobacteraceae bacterium]|nr:glycosyltransferase family 2 protein [Desulfobacteraceae bacterium]
METDHEKLLVSAIIPTFNRGWIVAEAVKSILNQDYPNIETIVIDDGSTDDTAKQLFPYLDKITYIKQENKGVSAARNLGIKKSSGKLTAFLDSDDLWTKEKISCQVNFFQNNPDAMLCQTEEIWIRNGKKVNPKQKHKKPSGMIFESSLNLCLVSPSAVMIKKKLFKTTGYFDENLPACEDYDLWLRISATLPIFLIDKPCTIKKGGHGDQLSNNHSLDKYRIKSLQKLLTADNLTRQQRNAAKKVFNEKCAIYGNGCIKRGKKAEGKYYLELAS